MIRAEGAQESVRLVVRLPAGSVAYVDRDWLSGSSHSVPSIAVASDGGLTWCDGSSVRPAHGVDLDTAVACCLLAVAREAAASVEALPRGSVEVTGHGLVASLVRRLIGDAVASQEGQSTQGEHPSAIVDTTGDPAAIVAATRRVAHLGTLVLAGENLGRRTELNLYPDVHVRGLTLVGVPPPLEGRVASFADQDDPLVESCRRALVSVTSGELLPTAAWYRVSS